MVRLGFEPGVAALKAQTLSYGDTPLLKYFFSNKNIFRLNKHFAVATCDTKRLHNIISSPYSV